MKIRLTLRPGNRGTKAMERKYGARLVAVRYRYDAARGRRLKTVEIIEEVVPWQPRTAPNARVSLHVAPQEAGVRKRLIESGARWNPDRATWDLDYATAVALGLEGRVVREPTATYDAAAIC